MVTPCGLLTARIPRMAPCAKLTVCPWQALYGDSYPPLILSLLPALRPASNGIATTAAWTVDLPTWLAGQGRQAGSHTAQGGLLQVSAESCFEDHSQ